MLIGGLMMIQTFFDIPWPGPWEASFTTGSIGLLGCLGVYIAWYEATFEKRGLLPTTDLWQNPSRSVPQVAGAGLALILLGWLSGREIHERIPEPAGMILMLFGFLALLTSLYAWLVLLGPLVEDQSGESE